MAEGPFEIMATVGSAHIFVGDSVTYFVDLQPDDVIVCGSHGGETATLFGAASGAKALILNDAGVGKDGAGIGGLVAVEPFAVAAAAVTHQSARIGSGVDTWEEGIISHCNSLAAGAGVCAGMAAWKPRSTLRHGPPHPHAGGPRRRLIARRM